ncbi:MULTISPECIES: UDP-glucose 4-epimerase family protein [unclassified Marinobacter]|uniref:UDP-glucose 4-epimerase family protein n=1 Tax=unclassified Marinobacter TaxID=83889 RepID=UPI0012A8EA9C|nr:MULTISPECIES: SDR family oxidoreductase [unclassified Marinobacter]QFS87722.1 GDP-6-deoxy-D-mannose reductase [Marinobacter sp. THAF197a]QFT51507.1 GDP-6-deoxy-D-mannose reductase [Marinobacter sp. THAF39]
MLQKKILLTGATGFIGGRLLNALSNDSRFFVTCVLREQRPGFGCCKVVLNSMSAESDWSSSVEDGQVVIHAAARAHVLRDSSTDPLAEFRKVNVEGTLNLARQAAQAGARRFVFISSIGVNGTGNSVPFRECDEPNPTEPYALSKWEAEQGLWEVEKATGMEVVIIRPPLVYGPNAPGNFGSLVNWVGKGLPLPLGAINNSRTLVALDNLVDLIVTVIDHPGAANQVFLAGDGEDISTTELLRGVGNAMGKPARLIPVPAGMLMFGAALLGRKAVAQRVLGSLQVDISKARNLLGWEPPLSVEEGLRRCFDSETSF